MSRNIRRLLRNGVLVVLSLTASFYILSYIFPKGSLVSSVPGLLENKIKKMGTSLNPYILRIIQTYPRDGSYKVLGGAETFKSFGTTRDIYYMGKKVATAGPEGGVYCVGIIFEVFMRAWELALKELGAHSIGCLDANNIREFRRWFYGARENEKTFVDALTKYGLGVEITNPELAEPGDLVQLWRFNKTGHSVVFDSWERDDNGKIVGIHFWSTQKTTNGIDYNTESIEPRRNAVRRDKIFIVRPIIPKVNYE